MSLQYDDDEDEMFDDTESEEDEENDISADQPPAPQTMSGPSISMSQRRPEPRPANPTGRRLRVRPMPNSLMQKHPGMVSMLMTFADGRQTMFVRK